VTDRHKADLPELLGEVNLHVRELAQEQLRWDPSDRWGFLCECGRPGCRGIAYLSLAEYEALRDTRRPLLAPGHRASPAQKARQDAAMLRDDAQALRAQARQQQKRARRTLGRQAPDDGSAGPEPEKR